MGHCSEILKQLDKQKYYEGVFKLLSRWVKSGKVYRDYVEK